MKIDFPSYWRISKSPFYSFLFTLPLFIIYELGIIFVHTENVPDLRNGADVIMRQLLEKFGVMGLYGLGLGLLAGFIGTFIHYKKKLIQESINQHLLIMMLIESAFWGFSLYIFLGLTQAALLNPLMGNLVQQVVLSIGAGIYEEFVFRVILIWGLLHVVNFVFQWKETAQKIASVFIAAVFFSLFHFIGDFAELPTFELFFIRFIAGIILGSIYILRGFGITAYAHGIYDLIIITKIVTI